MRYINTLIVCDKRVFSTPGSFQQADQLLVEQANIIEPLHNGSGVLATGKLSEEM